VSKIDMARRIVALNAEVTGEPGGIREAEKLANRETLEGLAAMLEDATTAAATKREAKAEGAEARGGDLEDQVGAALGNPLADAARTVPWRCPSCNEEQERAPSGLCRNLTCPSLNDADRDVKPANVVDAWAAKPWLRPSVRVVLPALEPGESDEAPDGLPAERGTVGRIMGDAGTCVVTVDEEFREGPEDTGERTVSIDDVELAPEPTLAGANAADRAAKHGVDLKRLQRKLELAQGRAKRAADEVARLEERIRRHVADAGRLGGGS
jgi:hypothetical protein